MNIGQVVAKLLAQHPLHRLWQHLEHPDHGSALPRGGRNLATDEPGAYDVELRTALQDGAELERVRQLAQVDRVVESREPAGRRSGGDAEQIPADGVAALEDDLVLLEIQLGHPPSQQQLDAKLAVLRGRTQTEALARNSSEQKAFGQVGPLIGHLGLAADDDNLALKAGITQARGHCISGGSAADDYCFRDSSRRRRSDQTRYPPRTATAKA